MLKGLATIAIFSCVVMLAPWSTSAPAKAESALTVMTFNIRYGTAHDGDNSWPNRHELCLSVLKDRDADLIGLQEALAPQLDEIHEALPGYAVVGVGRNDGLRAGEYAPLLIRTDRFAIDHAETTWLSDTPDKPGSATWGNQITRICTWVRLIDLNTGKAVWVYNMHLDHQSQESREKSVELVSKLIHERPDQDEPVIVMGDMNSGEDNSAVQYLRGNIESATGSASAPESPRLVDTYRAKHPDETEAGTFSAFRNDRSGPKIDHLLVSRGVKVLDADIDRTRGEDGRCPSDHDAVWARVDPAE